MKRRIVIAGSITILIIILLPVALILSQTRGQGIFTITAILLLVYVAIYVFGGVPKLTVYFIYGLVTGIFLILLPEGYQMPFVIIGTLFFVLNPLASFEIFLESHLSDEDVLPIRISLRGSFWPFFAYQKEMKNFYHLPQARKLYTKKWYLHSRQIATLLLFALGIFLFIHEINNIANSLDNFNWFNFFVFYVIIIVFVLTFFMYKKGFTTSFRTLVLSFFPILIFILLISDLRNTIKFSVGGGVLIMGIVISFYELFRYFQRVSYDHYHYYDVDLNFEVFANALFEPLVYNETFTKCAHYQIKVTFETFQKHLHDLLVYANYFKFIITAYAHGNGIVHVHADFHHKRGKRAERFKTFLEAKFKKSVQLDLIDDPNKELYEKTFFHRPDYIVARALNLANLLKELEIETKIIISIIAYFDREADLVFF
ncbi:MAG: hypothetical protein IH571_03475, partial [Acholeplasmataceae bacterium]|nr:hypothetical protein [Acholeplasmataceae bacterium]